MPSTKRVCRLLIVAVALHQLPAQGLTPARPNTMGFFFLGDGLYKRYRADSVTTGTERAPGYLLGIGAGLTRQLAVYFQGGSAFFRHGDVDRFRLLNFDGGVRLHATRGASPLVPYADLGLTWIVARRDTGIGIAVHGKKELTGSGFTVGAGALYYLTRMWALDARVNWTGAPLKTLKFGSTGRPDLKLDSSNLTLQAGVAWYPDLHPFTRR